MKYMLNLQRFAEEGTGSAAPETAGAETAAAVETTDIQAGETLADGSVVSPQVAAAMNSQMAKHPELREVYGRARTRAQRQAQAAQAEEPAEKTTEQEWEELKKGKYKDLYGRDVQGAINQRFKNQQDAQKAMDGLEPALAVLRERAGVQSNEELVKQIMDDDSLYEEKAAEAGMTVPMYKQFLQLQQERDEATAREQQTIQEQMQRQHFAKLCQQAEEFKKELPSFDLMEQIQNDPKFVQLTLPEVGLSVKQAFIALHHDEIMPQAMMAGMERAKQQLGQTIQAQRQRPVEGAMKSRGAQAAEINLDPRAMTRPERNKIYDLIHKGKLQWGG